MNTSGGPQDIRSPISGRDSSSSSGPRLAVEGLTGSTHLQRLAGHGGTTIPAYRPGESFVENNMLNREEGRTRFTMVAPRRTGATSIVRHRRYAGTKSGASANEPAR